MLQGGAAFAALGALTLGAASPAHADTYGWAYASAVGGEGVSETYITQDQTVSTPFSSSIGDWLVVEGTTTATVNADGATATTVIDSAKVSVTAENIEDILDPSEDDEDEDEDDEDDEDGDEGEGDDGLDEDGGAGEGDGGNEDDEAPGGSDGDDDGTDAPGDGGSEDPSAAPTEPEGTPSESVEEGSTDGPSSPPADSDEDEVSDTASAEFIELDDENSELVDGSDTVILEGTITGITVTTTQSWDGEVSHHADEGTFTSAPSVLSGEDGEELVLDIQPSVDQGVVQTEDAGFLWNDAYTNLYMNFLVDDEFVAGYSLAESAAGITTGAVDGGGDNGGGDGDGDGDGKNPPQKERDEDTLPKTEAKDAEPLAQTGSPLGGLIAAGAAIAAGGGAAAYLARRKKKNGEETAETEES